MQAYELAVAHLAHRMKSARTRVCVSKERTQSCSTTCVLRATSGLKKHSEPGLQDGVVLPMDRKL